MHIYISHFKVISFQYTSHRSQCLHYILKISLNLSYFVNISSYASMYDPRTCFLNFHCQFYLCFSFLFCFDFFSICNYYHMKTSPKFHKDWSFCCGDISNIILTFKTLWKQDIKMYQSYEQKDTYPSSQAAL